MMEESVVLLSSMSPKIKQKRCRKGITLLAIKNRSSAYQTISRWSNKDVCLVEEVSCSSSSSKEQKRDEAIGEPVIISDTSDDDELDQRITQKDDTPTVKCGDFEQTDKADYIKRWIDDVAIETTYREPGSVFTDLSTINGDGDGFEAKEKGGAVNSTFISNNCKRLDELFKTKNNCSGNDDQSFMEPLIINDSLHSDSKADICNKNKSSYEPVVPLRKSNFTSDNDEIRLNQSNFTNDTDVSVKKLVVEESFAVSEKSVSLSNDDGKKSISSNNDISLRYRVNVRKKKYENKENCSNLTNSLPNNGHNILSHNEVNNVRSIENMHHSQYTPPAKQLYNKERLLSSSSSSDLDVSSDSNGSLVCEKHVRDAEVMLDKLYGNSWREKQDLILPKTEPRNKIKPVIHNITHSERRPKKSLLYKNPYLEREKDAFLLGKRLDTPQLKISTAATPLLEKIKSLCSSDSSVDNGAKVLHKARLTFEDTPERSEYKDSCMVNEFGKDSDEYNIPGLGQSLEERVRKKLNNFVDDVGRKTTDKDKKKVTTKSNKDTKGNRAIAEADLTKTFKTNIDEKLGDQKSTIPDTDPNDRHVGTTSEIRTRRKEINFRGLSSSSESDSGKGLITKTKKKTVKKVSTSDDSDLSDSDNAFDKKIKQIHRSSLAHGKYSFLESLSGSVPIYNCDMKARIFRNNFKMRREELASELFKLYNERIFENKIPHDTPLLWNDRLRGTAGLCHCKKITRRNGNIERSVWIDLATKVVDSADRLRDTLVHEMCHAATWIVNCVSDGHGQYWKSWAYKAMSTFPELPPIKRCHDYTLNTKYTYRCTGCGYCIGRHRKSIDTDRKRCGYCYGRFEILINKVTKKGESKSVPVTPKKEATGFALFVKENYGVYKTPTRKHGEVMKLLGQKFQEIKLNK